MTIEVPKNDIFFMDLIDAHMKIASVDGLYVATLRDVWAGFPRLCVTGPFPHAEDGAEGKQEAAVSYVSGEGGEFPGDLDRAPLVFERSEYSYRGETRAAMSLVTCASGGYDRLVEQARAGGFGLHEGPLRFLEDFSVWFEGEQISPDARGGYPSVEEFDRFFVRLGALLGENLVVVHSDQ